MRVEYSLEVVCSCPVADCPDVYRVTVRSDRTVMAEDILAAAKELSRTPQTQEAFTQAMVDRLGVEVETAGVHSGVRTLVVCGKQEGSDG